MESNNNDNRADEIAVAFDCSKFGFENHISVKYGELNKTHDEVLLALKDGLPEEAHTVDVFNYVLDQCKDTIRKKLKLEL